MSASDVVHLRGGQVIPLEAYEVVLAVERAGHRLSLDSGDILIQPGDGLDPSLLAELKRWKPHAILALSYTADDRHLRTLTSTTPHLSGAIT